MAITGSHFNIAISLRYTMIKYMVCTIGYSVQSKVVKPYSMFVDKAGTTALRIVHHIHLSPITCHRPDEGSDTSNKKIEGHYALGPALW